MLIIYFQTIKKPEFIGQRNSPTFLYNGNTIHFGDKTLIGKYFKSFYPIIKVIWLQDLLG